MVHFTTRSHSSHSSHNSPSTTTDNAIKNGEHAAAGTSVIGDNNNNNNNNINKEPVKPKRGRPKGSKTKQHHPLLARPKRPKSAYNFFFADQKTLMINEKHAKQIIKEQEESANQLLFLATGKSQPAALPPDDNKERGKGRVCKKRKTEKKMTTGLRFSELAKVIGARWKTLDPNVKLQYQAKAKQEFAKFECDMKQYYVELEKIKRLESIKKYESDMKQYHNESEKIKMEEQEKQCGELLLNFRAIIPLSTKTQSIQLPTITVQPTTATTKSFGANDGIRLAASRAAASTTSLSKTHGNAQGTATRSSSRLALYEGIRRLPHQGNEVNKSPSVAIPPSPRNLSKNGENYMKQNRYQGENNKVSVPWQMPIALTTIGSMSNKNISDGTNTSRFAPYNSSQTMKEEAFTRLAFDGNNYEAMSSKGRHKEGCKVVSSSIPYKNRCHNKHDTLVGLRRPDEQKSGIFDGGTNGVFDDADEDVGLNRSLWNVPINQNQEDDSNNIMDASSSSPNHSRATTKGGFGLLLNASNAVGDDTGFCPDHVGS